MAAVEKLNEHWSSRVGFLLAAIGSSVGLGNFWRFPYAAGENGGSIFIIIYLVCVALVAYPVLVGEYAIGRRGGGSAAGSPRKIADDLGKPGSLWSSVGWVGILTGFTILSFYSVIAGWVLIYMFKGFSGAFLGQSPSEISDTFAATISNKPLVVGAHAVFMALTVIIVARGIKRGIEVAVQVLMPLFFVMLLGMIVFGALAGDLPAALAYLTKPDLSVFYVEAANGEAAFSMTRTADIVSAALGQAFFSVGLGSALMITYAAYLDKGINLTSSARVVAGSDTAVALIAGIAIFPIAFGFGQDPSGGPGLFFVTMPIAFSQMPLIAGTVLAGAFFLLAFFAALTSSISLLEATVSRFAESNLSRRVGAIIAGTLCWLVGLCSVFSDNFFDFADQVTEKIGLPLGGLLVAVFAGWIIPRRIWREEMSESSESAFSLWWVLVRWVASVGAVLIFIASLWAFVTNPPALLAPAG